MICNYISKINNSIQNIFLNIRFNDLPKNEIIKLIKNIKKKENIKIKNIQIERIQEYFKSDIRSMINYIQCNINNYDKFIETEIDNTYNKILEINDTENAYKLINKLTKEYLISHCDLLNKLIKVFLLKHVNELRKEHFMFLKSFYHERVNTEFIFKVFLDILYIYSKIDIKTK